METLNHLPDNALFTIQKHLHNFALEDLKNKIPCDEGNFYALNLKLEKFEIDSYQNMYNAITELKLWDFMKRDPPPNLGYSFWNTPEIRLISNAVDQDGHSGASFSICMRKMQYIAKHGWKKFAELTSPNP